MSDTTDPREFKITPLTPEQEKRIREIIREEVGKAIMDFFDGYTNWQPGIVIKQAAQDE